MRVPSISGPRPRLMILALIAHPIVELLMRLHANHISTVHRNTAKVTLCLLPVAPTTSDAAEHIGLASVDVIGSARRTAVDARKSAAVPEPTLRVRYAVAPQGMPPRSRVAAAVPRRLGVAACVASAPFGL